MRSKRTRDISPLVILIAVLAFSRNGKAAGIFVPVGPMTVARAGHTATLLADGRVLIAGGDQGAGTAELYDPTTATFQRIGSTIDARCCQSAVLLRDGNVFLAGGASAELYDSATRQFSLIGPLLEPQGWVVTVLLSNGEVLVAGDVSAQLYDPSTGTFLPAGPYAAPSRGPTATLLRDGRVLFVGDDPAQVYDPVTNNFSVTGSVVLPGLELESATLLTNGQVLIAGGTNDEVAPAGRVAAGELYDPAAGTFTPTAGSMHSPRDAHAAVRLADGRVLVVGGDTGIFEPDGSSVFGGSLASAELYDPSSGTFSPAGRMNVARTGPQATLLKNGDVLITGGVTYCGIDCFRGSVASAELYIGPAPRRRDVRR